jgi:hypothetical protein
LHCGTWLYHAACLPNARHVFHVGGDVDFDNAYHWLAPWQLLRSGRITVVPAIRTYHRGGWSGIPHQPLRSDPQTLATADRVESLVNPFADELARWPLYISVDKDVLVADDAIVNWDSGHLQLAEVSAVLTAFVREAGGRLAGIDLLGDWSPVRVQGVVRRGFHLTMHPPLAVDPAAAARRNAETNLALLEAAGVLEGQPAAALPHGSA